MLERAGTDPELKPELLDTGAEFIERDVELREAFISPVLREVGA